MEIGNRNKHSTEQVETYNLVLTVSLIAAMLLLAHLMDQYCFARWRLSVVVVCNAAGGTAAGRVGRRRAGRVGGRAADTRRASTVTFR